MTFKENIKKIRNKIIGGGGVPHLASELHFIKHLLLKQYEQNIPMLFDIVYESNLWGNGSGSGSDEKLCAGYVTFLQNFFATHNITSIVDVGCGDWQFSKNIDFGKIKYQGFDVASSIINSNIEKYQTENINFSLYDGDFRVLPKADLLLCKDVLIHLPNKKIQEFIDVLPQYKYALITNSIDTFGLNTDILPTEYRGVDLRLAPFSLQCEEVFRIKSSIESKITLLWKNSH